ncbi:hypothetical protein PsorP6_008666 [Peronosclerospora sorghi]|uniref:Uncharacterized protein n=1 Tax=Peronosclerospora sorghi TaxID=230839 RepID=A0ACC0W0J3_9STRA|nr:hypothetical protein PsorP6_008666 [Peronosclerospora sorghi]
MCGEKCAADFGFTRDDQDAFAIESYRRVVEASERGFFKTEITPVTIEGRRGSEPKVFDTDEEMFQTQPKKIPTLRSEFKKDGTITAANASILNDGAAAMDTVEFAIALSKAVPLALNHAGLQLSDVDYHEINEAF